MTASHSKDETKVITQKEYDHLLSRSNWLAALETAGVDNWRGIEVAQDLYDQEYDE